MVPHHLFLAADDVILNFSLEESPPNFSCLRFLAPLLNIFIDSNCILEIFIDVNINLNVFGYFNDAQ